ncbi:hypothetical protein FHG89_16900 [Micromonospora orduensis]|uniref:Uncharacterized protein n=1 Tax=Micromonospora orduensis TaxID=1420891 RepID=A0A5C4QLW9_9ACTN|nr:hypothetical protein [Micromonospora orduensis]TNH27871.1 hypothetical protein FHG89_16900 [Micromonospora orduensis]
MSCGEPRQPYREIRQRRSVIFDETPHAVEENLMIALATVVAIAGVLLVGVVVLVRRPADTPRVVRWSALAITMLVAAMLTPFTVDDSGAAASYLLGVPVVAASLPVLAQRFARLTRVADLVAALVIVGWGLLLGLGIGGAFLPAAVLLVATAAGAGASRAPATERPSPITVFPKESRK